MKQIVTVRARKSFDYQGQSYQAGDPVRMEGIAAATHARRGFVSLATVPAGGRVLRNRQMVAEAPAAKPPSARGGRRTGTGRRPTVATHEEVTTVATNEDVDRVNAYRRGDLTGTGDG